MTFEKSHQSSQLSKHHKPPKLIAFYPDNTIHPKLCLFYQCHLTNSGGDLAPSLGDGKIPSRSPPLITNERQNRPLGGATETHVAIQREQSINSSAQRLLNSLKAATGFRRLRRR